MSVSLYYTARRARPLNEREHTDIGTSVEDYQTDEFGEPFCLYGNPSSMDGPGDVPTVLAGATKLPSDNSLGFDCLDHWADLLSELRAVLPDATWRVSVDDSELEWDEANQRYNI